MGSQRHTPSLSACGTPKSHNRLQEQETDPHRLCVCSQQRWRPRIKITQQGFQKDHRQSREGSAGGPPGNEGSQG